MPAVGFFPPAGYTPPATVQANVPVAPTAPASTSAYKMQGLGALITPQYPAGQVLAIFQATATDSGTTVGEGILLQAYYGPMSAGTAVPANAAAVPGSAVALGPLVEWATGVTLTTAADLFQPIYVIAVAKGLIPGQQYWFDLAAESVITASVVALTNVSVTLVEIG